MERRFVLFLVISLLIIVGNAYLQAIWNPPKPHPAAEAPPAAAKTEDRQQAKRPGDEPAAGKQEPEAKPAAEPAKPEAKTAEKPAQPPEEEVPAEPPIAEQLVALGSADPESPYRMLVTLTNRGAGVVRAEFSSPRFHDLEDRSGYLGHLVIDEDRGGSGCRLDVVGPGTPADKAGLRAGDVIRQIDGTDVPGPRQLYQFLAKKRPSQTVELAVQRGDQSLTLPATLGWRPLEVLRPEGEDPLSFLLTLYRIDDENLGEAERKQIDDDRELPGVRLRRGTWKVESADQEHVTFVAELRRYQLAVTKTYRLQAMPGEAIADRNFKAYHLVFEVAVRNAGPSARKIAYQLDGPTGLPKEGYWYAVTVDGGLRDFVASFNHEKMNRVLSTTVAADKSPAPWQGKPVTFIGVDAQFFSCAIMPQGETPPDLWFAESYPLRVGKVDPDWTKEVNVSCRLVGRVEELKPGQSLKHQYLVFAGPKRPDLLEQYGLASLVNYGWFDVIAKPMVKTLHLFYAVVRNYGLAIVMLTVLVRLCMFPLSRKQALGAQKMQALQPEIKRLQEKYKGNVEARTKAQQELFRKHNYNPLSGCLVLFIQLPIFVALYRALGVDVELRQAPLLSESIRWCSNLAAPDMLFDWRAFMPTFITSGAGMLGLGPYFNLLPILTIVLFLWQQQKMMPPPTDENAAMQQKIMKYMMVFMGILFYKVASGLCIYFIASSLWGMAERQFLPKFSHPAAPGAAPPKPALPDARDGNPPRGKKARGPK